MHQKLHGNKGGEIAEVSNSRIFPKSSGWSGNIGRRSDGATVLVLVPVAGGAKKKEEKEEKRKIIN